MSTLTSHARSIVSALLPRPVIVDRYAGPEHNGAAAAALTTSARFVRCYHCYHTFRTAPAAQSLTCPACYKHVRVDDIVIDDCRHCPKMETAGTIFVRRRAKLSVRTLVAGMGLEVLGELQAGSVTAGRVYLGPRVAWQGDCCAGSVNLDPAAQITGGRFRIDPRLLGVCPTNKALKLSTESNLLTPSTTSDTHG